MAFNRKFNDGDIVIVSNPRKVSHQHLKGMEFTIVGHYGQDYSQPYRLDNGEFFAANELTLSPEKKDENGQPVKRNRDIFTEMNPQPGQAVKIKFIPTPEQIRNMRMPTGFQWDESLHGRVVGLVGIINGLHSGQWILASFAEFESHVYLPAAICEIVDKEPITKTIRLNDRHNAVVSKHGVFINRELFTFGIYDKIQEAIHKMNEDKPKEVKPLTLTPITFDINVLRLDFNKAAYDALNLSIGNAVKVVANMGNMGELSMQLGIVNAWISPMNRTVGEEFAVSSLSDSDSAVQLSNGYWYPAMALQLVNRDENEDTGKCIDIPIEHNWTAKVYKNQTLIGCQRFKNTVFPELITAINEFRN